MKHGAAGPRDPGTREREGDELLGHALPLLLAHALDADELGRERARPAEPGLDRRPLGRKIVPVERVADLEPKRVARAEPGGYGAPADEALPDPRRIPGGEQELDAILTRVTGAADECPDAGDGGLTEVEALRDLARLEQGRENRDRVGPLEREHRVVVRAVDHLDTLPVGDVLCEPVEVGGRV